MNRLNELGAGAAEKMYDGLLDRARKHAIEHSETFWDMFSEDRETESRNFFLSLPEEQREFLRTSATVEALVAG